MERKLHLFINALRYSEQSFTLQVRQRQVSNGIDGFEWKIPDCCDEKIVGGIKSGDFACAGIQWRMGLKKIGDNVSFTICHKQESRINFKLR